MKKKYQTERILPRFTGFPDGIFRIPEIFLAFQTVFCNFANEKNNKDYGNKTCTIRDTGHLLEAD